MRRRTFLTAATGSAAAILGARPAAADELPLGPLPGTRYPDPRIEVLDARFKYKIGNAAIERVCTGFRWCEGPVYFRDGGYLLWSDIPNNRIMRWCEDDGHVSVYRYPSNNSNGNTRDREGRLITCEHDTRRVTRTEHDGSITVLMDKFEGKPLNAPNDVVASGFGGPDGIAFSPDEKKLYIVDTGLRTLIGRDSNIRVFDVQGEKLTNDRIFAPAFGAVGRSDGVRTDVDGNVWCTLGSGDPNESGVRCYAPNGDLIGKILLPETCANLCFGGKKKNRLFMCGSTSIYAVYVEDVGAQAP